MRPRPSPPAAAGETTSPVWPRAPRRGGAGRGAAPGAAPRRAGRAAAVAAWLSPEGPRGRRCGEVSALREAWGLTLRSPTPLGSEIPARTVGRGWGSRPWDGERRTRVRQPGAPGPGAVGLARRPSERGSAGSPLPSSRWLQRRESLWSYWCLSFHIWRTELRGRGEFPKASRSGEGVDAGRAVGRGAHGPGSILAPHLNLFVNAHTHRDSAKQAVHSVEHKWSPGNYCRDKPGAVSSKNSRVCVLVERSCMSAPSWS